MASIQDYINSKKNMVCSECKETNFHINMVIRYEGGEPYISYGDALSVWCGNCEDECDLIEKPKCEGCELICLECQHLWVESVSEEFEIIYTKKKDSKNL